MRDNSYSDDGTRAGDPIAASDTDWDNVAETYRAALYSGDGDTGLASEGERPFDGTAKVVPQLPSSDVAETPLRVVPILSDAPAALATASDASDSLNMSPSEEHVSGAGQTHSD
jgi:hypothetical protein